MVISLFLSAFLAATFFPAQSEALLAILVLAKEHPVTLLVLVASVGNVLGSLVNWGIGRKLEHFRERKWFPVKETSLLRAQTWYRKYGRASLLLSWVPVIGDPITLAAGIMKEKILPFLLLVGAAKTLRYLGIVWLVVK